MKHILVDALLVSVCGCVSQPATHGTNHQEPVAHAPPPEFTWTGVKRLLAAKPVPLPTETELDYNPNSRRRFLYWYAAGYRLGITGTIIHVHWDTYEVSDVAIAGWDAGLKDGLKASTHLFLMIRTKP
jgi:hypothetical protein